MGKHPKSLSIFFATEMWERYGFYVIQSLLALYLALHFKWPDKQIYNLVGSFTALTYLSPLVGGWMADKLLGQKRAVLLGAFILLISYCFISIIEHPMGLTFSLAGIAVGTGLLKPNISSLLGNEYLKDCPYRESGVTIFYMGITSGIIIGTTLPSILNSHFGWATSFISAALGIVISIIVFIYGIIHYKINDYNPLVFQYKKLPFALMLIIVIWSMFFYLLNSPVLANTMFGLIVCFAAGFIFYSVNKESAVQAKKTLVIGLLCLISIMFWAFYFQMFMSWTLFVSRVVKPVLFGIEFHPPYYITIQSLGMLLIGVFMARKHHHYTLIQRGLSTGKKFLLAIICITLAYGIIVLASTYTDANQLIPPLFIIPAYLMISLAELLLSPVGLSAITLLADKNKVSTMMGIFFVSLGFGGFLSGKLAGLAAIPSGETNSATLKTLYASAFSLQLGILVCISLFCLLIFAVIKSLLMQIKATEQSNILVD